MDPVLGPVVTGAAAVGPGTAVACGADDVGAAPAGDVVAEPWAHPAMVSVARADARARRPTGRET